MTFDKYWTTEMRAVGATNYKRESLFYALAERAWDAAWRAAKKSEQAAWHAGLDAGREQGKAQQPTAVDGAMVLAQLRREMAEEKNWGNYTTYERGRLAEKQRCIRLLEDTNSILTR